MNKVIEVRASDGNKYVGQIIQEDDGDDLCTIHMQYG
jgi:hypothetical protein